MNIAITIEQPNFEYDIYHLIRAFFPDADRVDVQDADLHFHICFSEGGVSFRLFDRVRKTEAIQDAAICFSQPDDRPAVKNELKRLIYTELSNYTGRTLPWGDLTGIRPIKNVVGLFSSGLQEADIRRFLKQTYCMSDQKIELALQLAKKQIGLFSSFGEYPGADFTKRYSLYVDIPFCPSICSYCTFGAHPIEAFRGSVPAYLDSLKKELRCIQEEMASFHLDTIYIGGGTPTAISPEELSGLLDFLCSCFPAEQVREFTVEAGRPDTITKAHLSVLKSFPVTRISINPQTMSDATLKRIGRGHSAEDTRRAYHLARDYGFDNINMDMIIGLPGEGEAEVLDTLKEIRQMAPDSLTVHSLALKRAARLNLEEKEEQKHAFSNSDGLMEAAHACAAELGMEPYYLYRQKNIAGNFENTGYARPGKEGLYNILIMEECESILAAGSGGSTKLVHQSGIARVENVKDLQHYISRIDEMCRRKTEGIKTYLK